MLCAMSVTPALSRLLGLLRCRHEFGWPRRSNEGDYYQVCLVCGAEYGYDWRTMQRTPARGRGTAGHAAGKPRYRPWQPRERRLRWTCEMEFRRAGAIVWHPAMVENISRSGVLFHYEEVVQPIARGDGVEMMLEMPPEISGRHGRQVLCTGTVARCLPAVDGKPGMLVAATIAEYRFLRRGRGAA
jgi:hypothetical protein